MKKKSSGSKKPVIGITCEVQKVKPFYCQFDLVCDYRYIRAVIRAGGIPILLPMNPFDRDVSKLLEQVDGIVIIGGADIHPSFYGEKSSKKIDPMYRGRTYFEMHLYRTAQRKQIPVLAICYGMQLLNVIYGGTLHQDIREEIKGASNHSSKKTPLHDVKLMPGSLCRHIFGKDLITVHSDHHQAVKIPGSSLKVTAFSEDGVPESLEGPTGTVGVQWHPERQHKDKLQMKLFRYFIRMARESRRRKIKRGAGD